MKKNVATILLLITAVAAIWVGGSMVIVNGRAEGVESVQINESAIIQKILEDVENDALLAGYVKFDELENRLSDFKSTIVDETYDSIVTDENIDALTEIILNEIEVSPDVESEIYRIYDEEKDYLYEDIIEAVLESYYLLGAEGQADLIEDAALVLAERYGIESIEEYIESEEFMAIAGAFQDETVDLAFDTIVTDENIDALVEIILGEIGDTENLAASLADLAIADEVYRIYDEEKDYLYEDIIEAVLESYYLLGAEGQADLIEDAALVLADRYGIDSVDTDAVIEAVLESYYSLGAEGQADLIEDAALVLADRYGIDTVDTDAVIEAVLESYYLLGAEGQADLIEDAALVLAERYGIESIEEYIESEEFMAIAGAFQDETVDLAFDTIVTDENIGALVEIILGEIGDTENLAASLADLAIADEVYRIYDEEKDYLYEDIIEAVLESYYLLGAEGQADLIEDAALVLAERYGIDSVDTDAVIEVVLGLYDDNRDYIIDDLSGEIVEETVNEIIAAIDALTLEEKLALLGISPEELQSATGKSAIKSPSFTEAMTSDVGTDEYNAIRAEQREAAIQQLMSILN